MSVKLGTNLLSRNVQRGLTQATSAVSTIYERLSTGQRINKASDDAAGLAVSNSLRVDKKIFAQAARNINDGISAISVASGAMGELKGILIRIKELSAQSMNGTFSGAQRGSMQQEASALQSEWNRILGSSSFNGQNLLTGEGSRMLLQGGVGMDATLEVQIGEKQLAGGLAGSAGETTRVSTDSSGNQATGGFSSGRAISADGRYVAFDSNASNLVAGDTNGFRDAFIKDTLTGVTTRISTDSSGNQAEVGFNGSRVGAISADGRFVAFESDARNLVAGDTNDLADAFIKDTLTGVTTRISTDSSGNQATGGLTGSSVRAISADGRFVAFNSTTTNLVAGDTNGAQDAFIKDTLTGVTTRISTDSSGNQATGGYSSVRAISADGRFVAFESTATNLVAGDTNGFRDAFIKDTLTGVTTRISTDSSGNQATGGSSSVSAISADGRFVAFHSTATNLVAGDTNGAQDAFIKDTLTGVTTRISTDSSGNQATGGSSYVSAISADGRFVTFTSFATNLVAGDTNGVGDAFIKDTLTGVTTRISTDSSGNQATGGLSYVSAISADGRFVVFDSDATNLVAGDTNGQRDVFLRDLTKIGINEMSGMVVSNRQSAAVTFNLVDKLQQDLSRYEGILGATQSRAQTFVSLLYSQKEVTQAAESRIVDADIASETSELVRRQILQNATASLLGQANQQPQLALDLLRNI